MALKYPLVYDLVIVLIDLYLPEHGSAGALALPGLERIARFGSARTLAGGWRPWVARCVGAEALGAEPPACVAARCCDAGGAGSAWLATPVHCVADLASVHLEHRGLLKLPMAVLRALAAEFRELFEGSGFRLEPLASGEFVLFGPSITDPHTTEPARAVGRSIAATLPQTPALRRLGAEIEIWLHEHALNRARSARGELPVTSLWIWGGGVLPATPVAVQPLRGGERAYGCDPYVEGLWCAAGARVHPLPAQIDELIAAPARASVLVAQLAELLAADPGATLGDALARLDARWLAPAVRLVERGLVGTLSVLANDRCLSLRRIDRLKLWRRARPGLAGLA